jgi:hypothetical protein
MVVHGRVQNGVVVLERGFALPEGAVVMISYDGPPAKQKAAADSRIQVPLVHTGSPGSVQLTGERIAEIMDEEDAAS